MRLDLGCGAYPTGDTNVDYYINDIGHRTGVKGLTGFKIPKYNFIKWNLNKYPYPFANNSYEEVYSSNTIEHLDDPYKFLTEMVRISSFKIIVKCPHGLGERILKPRKNPYHKHYLSRKWFAQAAQKIGGLTMESHITDTHGLPTNTFSLLRIPWEITVEMRKVD